jgi:hypothetical protein
VPLGFFAAVFAFVAGLFVQAVTRPADALRMRLPRVVVAPLVRQVADLARGGVRREGLHPAFNDGALAHQVVWLAGRTTKGMIDIRGARHTDVGGDGERRCQAYGWYSGCFECTGNQSDRLMANGSNGYE